MKWASAWQNQQNDVRPAKTQISLGIHPVWSESSLSAWRNLGPQATHWAQCKECPGWPESLLGAQVILLVLSCHGSNSKLTWCLSKSLATAALWSHKSSNDLPTSLYFFADSINHDIARVWKMGLLSQSMKAKMTCVPSKDSDQPAHPCSLIRAFIWCSMSS